MKQSKLIRTLIISALLSGIIASTTGCGSSGKAAGESTTEEPTKVSKEAREVLKYLNSINGKYILSGQEESNPNGLTREIEYIKGITGKYPAVHGFDIRSDVADPVLESINSWKQRNQLITFSWHMGAPPNKDSYDNSKKLASIAKVLEKGTPENIDFMSKLDAMAVRLQRLKDEKVPVLWRPFHEMNGNWFWWGPKKGSGNDGPMYVKLWKTMYDYYTKDKKLDNLIWVWGGSYEVDQTHYPGPAYVHIVGTDTYHKWNYPRWRKEYELLKNLPGKRMVALTENDGIPDPDELKGKENSQWLWFLTWHTRWIRMNERAFLKKVFNHEYVLTADELPKFVK